MKVKSQRHAIAGYVFYNNSYNKTIAFRKANSNYEKVMIALILPLHCTKIGTHSTNIFAGYFVHDVTGNIKIPKIWPLSSKYVD